MVRNYQILSIWQTFLFNPYVFLKKILWPLFRFKFDDERVTKEDIKRALEEQYGGEEEVQFTNLLWILLLLVFMHSYSDIRWSISFCSYRRLIRA